MSSYAELHCLSNFTFLRGASHAEELVERARSLEYAALAITDECSLAGVVRAHLAAKEYGLKLIIGAEIQLADGPKLVLLATNREGYGNLSHLITQGRRAATKGTYYLTRDDFSGGLPGCLALLIPGIGTEQSELSAHANWLARTFSDRAWIAVELFRTGVEAEYLLQLMAAAQEAGLPLVASGDVHMHVRARQMLQDTLTAIRLGTQVQEAGSALYQNGERHLRSISQLEVLYPAEFLAETVRIAERCSFVLDSLRYEYPEEVVPTNETAAAYLRRVTLEGARRRWAGGVPAKVRNQIEHELVLISELHYEGFFLTIYDIVAFARSKKILCQGRGSAANSAVCYCLGITEVDPSRSDMLFERFISKERNEPPDIDVDFEHQRREEVMQYVYGKYGRDRAALAATVITYRPKSALRDVGKTLGFDLSQVDRLAKSLAWWDRRETLNQRLVECGFDPDSRVIGLLLKLVGELIGFPRHLSQHVGGFVISRGPLSQLVPIENAAMENRTIIQWDKDDIDALGLLKVDCLCLGMLSAIRRALDLVAGFRHTRLAMADIPAEDPEVYEMLCKGDSVGVFQVESRAQMAMLPRLRPRTFYDLVIEVAIVRPGPIQGGMVHPYLRRRQGAEPVTYPSEAVKGVLARTLGVPIFQEQVMQLAIVAAGFTPGESDQLRRSMAAWRRRGGLQHLQRRLLVGMEERGYTAEFADQIFRQIQGFASYGFPESHAASFGLLVYVSAWLKCHEPAAFAAGLLNSQPMGFYAPAQLVQDARRHGVEVRAVAVLLSGWDCSLETGAQGSPALRLGLRMVGGLQEAAAERIVGARAEQQFTSVDDLAHRAALNARDLKCLAAAGAMNGLARNRPEAYWLLAGIEKQPLLSERTRFSEQQVLLRAPTEGQDIIADYASIGLTLGRHPVALLRSRLAHLGMRTAAELRTLQNGQLARAAGIVINRQRPETASGVIFMTLEDETGYINVVVWRDLSQKQRSETLGARLLGVHGVLQREGEVTHLVARRLVDHSALLGKLAVQSRDFH